MYKCLNCKWEGKELSINPIRDKCPVCGDEIKVLNYNPQIHKPKVEDNLDIEEKLEDQPQSIVDRVKDVVDDLVDDGKRNYSNRKKKKSVKKKK